MGRETNARFPKFWLFVPAFDADFLLPCLPFRLSVKASCSREARVWALGLLHENISDPAYHLLQCTGLEVGSCRRFNSSPGLSKVITDMSQVIITLQSPTTIAEVFRGSGGRCFPQVECPRTRGHSSTSTWSCIQKSPAQSSLSWAASTISSSIACCDVRIVSSP